MTCDVCGAPVTGRRADAEFCSTSCRQRARWRRERARRASDPEYAAEQRERGAARQRASYERHPEQARARNAAKDRAAESRRWRETHPEHYRTPAYRAAANAANARYVAQPEAKRARADRQSARRARARETLDRLRVWLLGAGCCGVCGQHVALDAMHVDHVIPLARGGAHSYANVQPAHPVCNMRKGARLG